MFERMQYAPTVVYVKGSGVPIADLLTRDVKKYQIEQNEEEELEIQLVIAEFLMICKSKSVTKQKEMKS